MMVAELLRSRPGGAGGGSESDVELMRTILGEHVPQSVILTCLNACAFDVSAALNWYFMEVASHAEAEADELGRTGMGQSSEPASAPFIQSGLSLTLHSRAVAGMVAKTDSYYATLTRGLPSYDMLTPSNEKFLTIRLRKRGWRTGLGTSVGVGAPATQRPYFTNGDVVTLECNGLWLRASQLNRVLQWKSPADDDRCKFVIRGLPLGRNLRPGDYFFLTSYKWKDKEVVMKDERPVGISSYNTSMHRCFLGLEKIKTANQRLYLYAKMTENAVSSLPKATDPVDVNHLTINVMGTPMSAGSVTLRDQSQPRRKASIADEIVQTDVKIDQMANIIGKDVSRDRLANFLDGAGGSVQVALEHYFMSVSTIATTPPQRPQSVSAAPAPSSIDSLLLSSAGTDGCAGMTRPSSASSLMPRASVPPSTSPVYRDSQHRKPQELHPEPAVGVHRPPPRSELILPIPSELPPPVPISAPGRFDSSGAPIDFRSTFVGEPSPGIPTSVASMASVSAPPLPQEAEMLPSTSLLQASPPRPPLSPASVSISEEKIVLSRNVSDAASTSSNDALQHWQQQQEPQVESLTIQDFEMLSVLGKGSFGAVMLVRFKKDGRVFALKIIKKTNMDRSDVQNAMEERQILQRINHPYICGLVFAFQTNERLYLGMKYYAAGDLFYHLNLKGRLDVRDATLYSAELVLAISYLHKLNILYRDLKPSNIMIDSEGHIGVVDFGLSKQHIYGSSFGVKTLSGTAEYVAPEALAQTADGSRNYGKAYDWWSLGIVLYEMLVGESPFYDENEHTMLSRIAYSEVVYPSDFPRDAHELVGGLLVKDPAKRLGSEAMGGVDAIKACRFFRRIDWDKLERRQVKAHWTPKLSSETDTRYVDPEFIDEGPPSAAYDPSANSKSSLSKRFSQFSFNYNLR